MCCVLLLMGLIGPRVAFLWAWFFTDEVDQAYSGVLIPLLGLVFLPWTALFYAIAWAPLGGVSFVGWLFVGLGLIMDIGTYSSRSRMRDAS